MEFDWGAHTALISVSRGYSVEEGTFPRVTHPSAAHPEGCARLACVKPAASVRSEPGSNSQVETTPRSDAFASDRQPSLTDKPLHIVPTPVTGPEPKRHPFAAPRVLSNRETHQTVKLTPPSSSRNPRWPICKQSVHRIDRPNRPHIPSSNCQVQRAIFDDVLFASLL